MSEKAKLLGKSKDFDTSNKYGSISQKHSLIDSIPKTHFTKKQCIIVSVVLLVAAAVFITTLVIGLPRLSQKRDEYFRGTFPVFDADVTRYASSAVVVDGEVCASIGRSILEANGSAVDSAIAMSFCDEVVNPQSMGLGGGFLMVIYSRERNSAEVIDARELAPRNANSTMKLLNKGLSVAIPGQLKGLQLAHQKYGKLNWSSLIEPSIKLCQEGVPISRYLESIINEYENDIINNSLSKIFVNNNTKQLLKTGELLVRPKLAETFAQIAKNGVEDFYNGTIASNLVDEININGGIWTKDDLINYQVKSRLALNISIHQKYNMLTVPPPGSGSVVAFILNMLNELNLTCNQKSTIDNKILNYHKIIETFKLALAEKSHLADPEFVDVSKVLNQLTSEQFVKSMVSKIKETAQPIEYYIDQIYGSVNDQGTGHINVISSNGDAVSLTSTINTPFGSKILSESTGIIFNDEMYDFDLDQQSAPNRIEPGKRPLSSMSPTILTDKNGQILMVTGAIGGTRIVTSMALVLHHLIGECKTLKESIDELRLHYDLSTNKVLLEADFPKVYQDGLFRFEHEMDVDSQLSSVYTIMKNDTNWYAAVDHRKGGSSDGF